MQGIFQQFAVGLAGLVPFTELSYLIAHEAELFSGVCRHIEEKLSALREFVLVISPHLLHYRCFSVYAFIMREREQEQFAVEVLHRECEHMIILTPLGGGHPEIVQSIVHPAHVPFVIEAEPVVFDRSSHLQEIGRILRYEHHVPVAAVKSAVEPFHKIDSACVHAA